MPKKKRETSNKQNISVLLHEDPEYPCKLCENEHEFNFHSCEICETWFHDDCNKLPKQNLQNLGKVKGLFWKSEDKKY